MNNFEEYILNCLPQSVLCPECKKPSQSKEWQDRDLPCEDCGDHPATECPRCGYVFDTVRAHEEDFKT